MSTVLIVDDDSGMLSVLEGYFQRRGHRAICLDDPTRAVGLAERAAAEAVVLDLNLPLLNGWAILDAMRRNPKTRDLPIVVLSSTADAPVGLRGLRRGADDVLTKPLDPSQLVLRVERLIEGRTVGFSDLLGRLDETSCSELLRGVAECEGSGIVEIHSPSGNGRIEILEGRLDRALFGVQRGAEALLSMIELDRGCYHFQPQPLKATGSSRAEQLPELEPLLALAEWLGEELERRSSFVPEPLDDLLPTGVRPATPRELEELPIADVLEVLGREGKLSFVDLLSERLASPLKMRLAVAWLVEHRAVSAESRSADLEGVRKTTLEDLDAALRELFQEAVFRGYLLGSLEVLMVAERKAWGQLAAFVEALPEAWLDRRGRRVKAEVLEHRAGQLCLSHEGGSLTFRFATLEGPCQPVLDRDCVGAVLCLDGEGPSSRSLIGALESASSPSMALVVAAPAESRRELESCAESGRWRWLDRDRLSPIDLLLAMARDPGDGLREPEGVPSPGSEQEPAAPVAGAIRGRSVPGTPEAWPRETRA